MHCGSMNLILEETDENKPVQGALGDFRQAIAVESGIFVFEQTRQFIAQLVEHFQETVVNFTWLDILGAPFGKRGNEFFQRTVRHGFMGKQPIDFGELFRVFVVGIFVFADVARERLVNVRLEAAIHNFKLLEVVEDADFGVAAPAVAVDLKVIVGRGDVAVRFLGLDEKADVAIIRMEIKSVVGAALGNAVFLALNFDFLFQRIFLRVVVHVPAEGEPKFVNEIAARLLFLIGRGQVEFLVGPEIGNQFFDPSECLVEGRWHLRECAPEDWQRQAAPRWRAAS